MPLARKNSVCIIIAIITIILIGSINPVRAEDKYPLENGEKLIEETVIDQSSVEIYTQLDENYYIKRLQRNEGQWITERTELICPNGTGLKVNGTVTKGDRKLAAALEGKLESYGMDTASLPLVVDHSSSVYLPPIGTQNENSCVGWSAGYYLRTYQQGRDIGWKVKDSGNAISSHVFSPTFIYNQIRQGGAGVDGGAFMDDAGDLLKTVGAATLESFPYIPKDIYTLPDSSVILSAYPHRISQWMLLFSKMDSKEYIIQKTKEYLNTGDLVAVGSKVGLKFQNPYMDDNGTSIITRENYPPYMHAYVIVGYDDTLVTPDGIGAFKLVNSWGENWGNGGFSYISYEGFSLNVLEGYVFTDLVNAVAQELSVDINDNTIFNINFAGEGRFDYKILDSENQTVYQENNLHGQQGLNTIVWGGSGTSGNRVSDGSYTFEITPYKGNAPKAPRSMEFCRASRVAAATASTYSYEGVIQYVNIPVTFKAAGSASVKIEYGGDTFELVSDDPVVAGESKVYTIYTKDFDFNNIDLSHTKIIIDVI